MAESDQSLKLDLGANGTFSFRTSEEVHAWLSNELDVWTFAFPHQSAVANQYKASLKNLRARLSSDIGAIWKDFVEAAKSVFGTLITSTSRRGKIVLELKAQGDDVAAAALAYLSGVSVGSSDQPQVQRGMLTAAIQDGTQAEAVAAAVKAFDDLNNRVTDWWATQKDSVTRELLAATQSRTTLSEFQTKTIADLEALRARTVATFAEIETQYKEGLIAATTGFNGSVATFNKTLGDLTKANADKMKAIEDTYSAKLSVHAAVTYWTKKKELHAERARTYGLAFAGCLVVSAFILALVLWAPGSNKTFLPMEADWTKLPVHRVVVLGLLVTGLIWATRTVARLFFSNLHLYTDADERVVMVTTYLALLKEEAALKPEDRTHIIETLFRKTSTGIVREDANPPLLIQNLLNKG